MSPNRSLITRLLATRNIWLPIIISVLLVGALFMPGGVQFEHVAAALTTANYLWLVPAILLFLVGLLVRAFRWQALLRSQQAIPIADLFSISVIGFFVNSVLPLRVGEFVRSKLIADRYALTTAGVLASIFAERVFDGLTLLAFLVAVGPTIQLDSTLQAAFQVAGASFLALVFFGTVVVITGGSKVWLGRYWLLVDRLPHRVLRRLGALGGHFAEGLRGLSRPKTLIPVVGFSILAWLIEAVVYGLVLVAFGVITWPNVWLLMTSAANLGTVVPSSQGGFGPFEFFGARSLELAGIDPSIALAATVVAHATVVVPIIVIGAYVAYRRGLTLGDLSRSRQSPPKPFPSRELRDIPA